MKVLRSKIRNIRNKLFPPDPEQTYYTDLFTRNPDWSSPEPNPQETLRWDIIQDFLLTIDPQRSVGKKDQYHILDIGCGRGWLSNLLSGYGRVIGIEPVKPVVAWGKRLFPALDLRHGIAIDLIREGKKGFFDLVVCSEVIEHIPDKKKPKFLKEINALLKAKGYLIITTPRKEAEQDWKRYGSADQPVEDWLSEQELCSLLTRNGFECQRSSRFSIAPAVGAPPVEIYQLWLARKL